MELQNCLRFVITDCGQKCLSHDCVPVSFYVILISQFVFYSATCEFDHCNEKLDDEFFGIERVINSHKFKCQIYLFKLIKFIFKQEPSLSSIVLLIVVQVNYDVW